MTLNRQIKVIRRDSMNYELVYIVSSVVPETEHAKIQEEILANLSDIKAKIITPPYSLGRKRLAYIINGQKHGFYVAMDFELEEITGLKELDTHLKHNKNLLRHLVIKKDLISEQADKKKRENKLVIEKSASLVESSTTKESKTEDSKENLSEKKSDEKAGDPAAEGPERSREEVKVDLDDLDSKLDQILEKEQ